MIIGFASGDYLPAHRAKDGIPHWGGSGWARIGQYLPHIRQKHTVVEGTLTWKHDHFAITDGTQQIVDVDIVVLQRLMHDNLPDHIRKAQAIGQYVINDLDDWYWGLDPRNDAFWSSHPKRNPHENRDHYRKVIAASDLLIVSTNYLKERVGEWARCPIEVVLNTVDVARFTPLEHTDSTVPTVGWVGATSHRSGDLETIATVLKPLIESGDFKFQHGGHYPHAKSVSEILGVAPELVKVLDAVDATKYPTLMTMDVGIAPLSHSPFNYAKSDIKLLEYSASGIPWVATDCPSYESLHKTWGLGRVAKRPKHWIQHLNALKDPEVRAKEGAALREAVWARNIDAGAHTLLSLLEQFS